MTELENKIHNISGVAANSALNAIENKIPDISCLAKKHCDTKLVKLKRNVLIKIMIDVLLLQNLKRLQ